MAVEKGTQRADAEILRKLRFVAKLPNGTLRRLFKLVTTDEDTSFYLIPYGPGNSYHASQHRFGAEEKQKSIRWSGQVDDDDEAPKLTLHRSGIVRAHIGAHEAGRLEATPFAELRGQHIATVHIHSLSDMPEHTGKVRTAGRDRDLVTSVGPGVDSLRAVIRANSHERLFEHEDTRTGWMIPMRRQDERLYIGISVFDDSKLGENGGDGVSLIGGWDIRKPGDTEMIFLMLRCC